LLIITQLFYFALYQFSVLMRDESTHDDYLFVSDVDAIEPIFTTLFSFEPHYHVAQKKKRTHRHPRRKTRSIPTRFWETDDLSSMTKLLNVSRCSRSFWKKLGSERKHDELMQLTLRECG
jgi:hypothetical protein